MNRDLELYYRDELRMARAAVLRDAEAFPEVLFAIERTGAALTGRLHALDGYRPAFAELARRTPLARRVVADRPFGKLYDLVQHGRNDALHQGAFARHLAGHSIELALILEDALANGSDRVGDYMVRGPVVAHSWQPLRVIRHQLLSNSFSFLPLYVAGTGWRVISDLQVAKVLRQATKKEDRAVRLSATVASALEQFGLQLDIPQLVGPDKSVAEVLKRQSGALPVLVVAANDELLGIVTPFDLL